MLLTNQYELSVEKKKICQINAMQILIFEQQFEENLEQVNIFIANGWNHFKGTDILV